MYNPGLHIIAELSCSNTEHLLSFDKVRTFLDQSIQQYGLCKVGEVYHQFSNAGYTAVVCLTESHISLHTWPEFNRITFDVFLSNYLKVNDQTAENIFQGLVELTQSENVNVTRLFR